MRTATATAAFEPTEAWQLALAPDSTVDVLKVEAASSTRRASQGSAQKHPAAAAGWRRG